MSTIVDVPHRYPPNLHFIYLFNKYKYRIFKHDVYSPFFSSKCSFFFVILTCLLPVLFTFYIQGVLKLKKNNSGTKRLSL